MHYKYVGVNGTTDVLEDKIIIKYKDYHVQQFIAEPIYKTTPTEQLALSTDYSFVSNLTVMGYIIECPGGDFMPANFNVWPDLIVEYKQGKSVTITMDKEINERTSSISKEWFDGMKF